LQPGNNLSWDEFYSQELTNFTENDQDQGEEWFSESGADVKVVRYLDGLSDQGVLSKSGENASSFLDIGTGNGQMLFTLRDEGWAGYMLGIDYSSHSVELARRIERKRRDDAESPEQRVDFAESDVLSESLAPEMAGRFQIVLDKGTFDAISLGSDTDEDCRRKTDLYRARIKAYIAPGGIFVITSCNWTEEELRHWLEDEVASGLTMRDRIPYRAIRFGGKEGQTVVTICFEKAAG
jgi:EEF1A lysine methyltransferase 2